MLSKIIGVLIIISSAIFKLPEILELIKTRNPEGISLPSLIIDLAALTIYMSYNYLQEFPFTQWGEAFVIVIQTKIMGVLVLHYGGATEMAAAFGIIYSIFFYVFMSGMVPINVLWALQFVSVLLLIALKLSQARTNYEAGHTKQVTAFTVFLSFVWAFLRIFTSIPETGDLMNILTNLVRCICYGIIAAQVWCYWDKTNEIVQQN